MSGIVLKSEVDTERMAQALVAVISDGDAIGLCGGLGAGKTTFVRYLVVALGGDASHVASPSYSLQNEYPLPHGRIVEHWDLYRLHETPLELLELPERSTVRIVEWPERCEEVMADLALVLRFFVDDNGDRRITFEGPNAQKAHSAVVGCR